MMNLMYGSVWSRYMMYMGYMVMIQDLSWCMVMYDHAESGMLGYDTFYNLYRVNGNDTCYILDVW